MLPPFIEAPASIFLSFFVQAFMLLFLFFALIFGIEELVLFSLILIAMSLGAYLWSRVSLNRVKCVIALNRVRIFPGEELKIEIRAVNSKPLPVLFKVDLFAPGAVTGSDMDQWISEEIGLLWHQQAVFFRNFHPRKRGVFDLGPPILRGGDLFGFFSIMQTTADRSEFIVYPRIVDIRQVPIPKRGFYGIPGSRSPVEDPIYVFGTRDYQPGSPARRIHWKASARHHRLQEKLCEPAQQEKVLILLDVDQFENESAAEDFEKSIEVIASLVLQLDRRGIAVGFVTNGHIFGGGPKIIPVSGSPLKMAAILETLARMGAEKTDTVLDILSRGYMVPWGVSSLYFACSRCNQIRAVSAFMKQRNISVRFIFAQRSSGSETGADPKEEHVLYLGDIFVPENPKR